NQATLDTLGFEEKELVGKPFTALVSEASPKQDLMFTGSVRHIEAIYKDRQGNDVPVFFSCSVVRDSEGELESIVTIAQDISERKRAERELMASEQRFRAIFASSAIGMAHLGTSLQLSHSNRALRKMLAYREGELNGLSLDRLLSEEDFTVHRPSLEELLDEKRESVQFECRFRRGDG
ncbi:MAG: PAS domain S-box protein, partial [Rhodocyclaceae bacterium]|nr:PAS domain S-box protein [Rhodocyclaceae bacterium]